MHNLKFLQFKVLQLIFSTGNRPQIEKRIEDRSQHWFRREWKFDKNTFYFWTDLLRDIIFRTLARRSSWRSIKTWHHFCWWYQPCWVKINLSDRSSEVHHTGLHHTGVHLLSLPIPIFLSISNIINQLGVLTNHYFSGNFLF